MLFVTERINEKSTVCSSATHTLNAIGSLFPECDWYNLLCKIQVILRYSFVSIPQQQLTTVHVNKKCMCFFAYLLHTMSLTFRRIHFLLVKLYSAFCYQRQTRYELCWQKNGGELDCSIHAAELVVRF